MRVLRWVLGALALACVAVAVVLALLAPGAVRAPQGLTGETTVNGVGLSPEQVGDVVERERLAMLAVVTGERPDPALGPGVIAAARDAAGIINETGTAQPGSVVADLVGWRVLEGKPYVTVDYAAEWTGADEVSSATTVPVLLTLTPHNGAWDVAAIEQMPDGGLHGESDSAVAAWAGEGFVWPVLLVLAAVALTLAIVWRTGAARILTVIALLVLAAAMLYLPGGPDSASGGQGDGIVANALAEWPLIPSGGWLSRPETGGGSVETYARALAMFWWAAAAALLALALAILPVHRAPWAGNENAARPPRGGERAASEPEGQPDYAR